MSASLSSLRTQIRNRCDLNGSSIGYITDTELNSQINGSYSELYDICVEAWGDDYFFNNAVVLTVSSAGGTSYALPDGVLYSAAPAFYKLLGCDASTDVNFASPQAITLYPYELAQRNDWNSPLTAFLGSGWWSNVRYRLQGSYIDFRPGGAPSNLYVKLLYIPVCPTLILDADTVNGIPPGYEDYIVTDCCIKSLAKQKRDVSTFGAQKAALLTRLRMAAAHRTAGQPHYRTDRWGRTSGGNTFGGNGWGC